MSDDESGITYTKRAKHLHYGTLEDGLRQPSILAAAAADLATEVQSSSTPVTVTISGPNINTHNKYYEIQADGQSIERQSQLEAFELRKKARSIAVSTDDVEVRAHLRHLNQPMCLFGEDPADRRERLRQLLARVGVDAIKRDKDVEKVVEDKDTTKTWYHEGSESLLKARYRIAQYSLPRAMERLQTAKANKEIPLDVREGQAQELYKKLRTMEISCSQVADQRPISSVRFSPNGRLIATSSWSGLCKLWDVPSLEHRQTLRAHNVNCDDIEWHPHSTISQAEDALNLASCGVDGSVYLWSLTAEEPLHSLAGHQPHRVSSLDFDPSGRYLGTCCYDNSWRLWDLEAQEEILHQEGHSKPVHDIAFQGDGSLVASAGRDSFGRVWDLRTGRCIMFMEGHLKGIISLDFSPNGYQLVTGSEDNTVKIWNIRQRKLEYTIAAHTNLISSVAFEAINGNYIISASYDHTIKLWAHPAWTPIKTLSGHDGKVMSVDMTSDNGYIVSSSFDRTFKLWEAQQL